VGDALHGVVMVHQRKRKREVVFGKFLDRSQLGREAQSQAAEILGQDLTSKLRDLTLSIYAMGVAHAETKGIIIADTKFEFGIDKGEIVLIDEVLTPDSSRFWPKDKYAPGRAQPSYDKQFVRDYLEEIKWNKQPPVPSLPDEVISKTRDKYIEAYRVISGRELEL